jgi:hypothetical protein
VTKIQADLYEKTFEEGIECSPFEEHVAVNGIWNNQKVTKYTLDPVTQTLRSPEGRTITQEAIEESRI